MDARRRNRNRRIKASVSRPVESAAERSLRWSRTARLLAAESAAAHADGSVRTSAPRAHAYRRASRAASVSAAAAMTLFAVAGTLTPSAAEVGELSIRSAAALPMTGTVAGTDAARAMSAVAAVIPAVASGTAAENAAPGIASVPAYETAAFSTPKDPLHSAPALADPTRCLAPMARSSATLVAALPGTSSAVPVPHEVSEAVRHLRSPMARPTPRPLIEIIPFGIGAAARSVSSTPLVRSLRPQERPVHAARSKSVSVVATCGFGSIVRRGDAVFHRPPACI